MSLSPSLQLWAHSYFALKLHLEGYTGNHHQGEIKPELSGSWGPGSCNKKAEGQRRCGPTSSWPAGPMQGSTSNLCHKVILDKTQPCWPSCWCDFVCLEVKISQTSACLLSVPLDKRLLHWKQHHHHREAVVQSAVWEPRSGQVNSTAVPRGKQLAQAFSWIFLCRRG